MGAPRIVHSEETIAFIRDRAGSIPDHIIGELLGFSGAKVRNIRKAHGIPSGYVKRRPQAIIDAVRREYVELGRPAKDVGAMLNITGTSVRRIAHENKMGRPRRMQAINAGNAVRAYLAAHPRPRKEPVPRRFVEPISKLISDDDNLLIADFMANRTVTILPPGRACGTTRWEDLLGTARPPGSNWKDEQARGRAQAANRRQQELARTA